MLEREVQNGAEQLQDGAQQGTDQGAEESGEVRRPEREEAGAAPQAAQRGNAGRKQQRSEAADRNDKDESGAGPKHAAGGDGGEREDEAARSETAAGEVQADEVAEPGERETSDVEAVRIFRQRVQDDVQGAGKISSATRVHQRKDERKEPMRKHFENLFLALFIICS